MQAVVTTILEHAQRAGASRVSSVQLEIGISGHFTEEAVRQYFELLTRETSAEGASLALSWLPATYQCLSCQQRFESCEAVATCPACHDLAYEISHQDVCRLGRIELLV